VSFPPAKGADGAVSGARVGRDAGYVLTSQLLAIALGFAVNVVAARAFPTSEFAALSWSLTWLAWLALCAQLGLMQAGTVLMAVEGHAGLRARLRPVVVTVLANAAVVAVVWWVVLGPLVVNASEDEAAYRSMLLVVGLWVPVAALGPVVAGMLRGLHRFRDAALYGEYVRRAVLLGAIGVVVLAGIDREAATVAGIAVAVETVVAAVVIIRIDHTARSRPPSTAALDERGLRRRGISFVLPTIDAPILPQAGVWILALVRPSDEVALFSVAVGISFIYGLPVFAGARVLGPRYTRARADGRDVASLEPMARHHANLSFAFVALVTLSLALVGEWAVGLVFGEQFREAATVAVIIGLGAAVNAATGTCAAALMHCDQERVVGITAVLAAGAYLLLGLTFGNQWGANGVAAAAALVISSRNLYLAAVARRRLGLTTWIGRTRTSTTTDP